eukprot:1158484-Pelagomonas_calceolata.AAC.11
MSKAQAMRKAQASREKTAVLPSQIMAEEAEKHTLNKQRLPVGRNHTWHRNLASSSAQEEDRVNSKSAYEHFLGAEAIRDVQLGSPASRVAAAGVGYAPARPFPFHSLTGCSDASNNKPWEVS